MNEKPLANDKFGSNKKLGLEWTMHGLAKPFRKSDPKNSKNQSEIAHVNKKKPLATKRNFVQTTFSHSTLKLEQKNSRRKTTRFFAPISVSAWQKPLLQSDFKNYGNVSTDLKKKRLNTIQILLIVKT